MAKLRRSAGRLSPVKKSNAAKSAARPKARPAVKKPAPKPAPKSAAKKPAGPKAADKVRKPAPKPAPKPAAKKPAGPKAADKVRKPAARPAPKPAPKPAAKKPAGPKAADKVRKPAARPAPKPKPAPPPRRSTYADAVLLYERGLHALQAKRYRDAADTLRRVIAEFPEEIELHERARLYIRVCERQLAPLDDTPKTPEEQVYAATLALNTGALDRAVSLLNGVLQRHADNDAAEYMLGVAMATKGDQQGAMRHLARALELNPDCRDSLRKEPELESLRETPELRALVAAASRRDRRKPTTKR